MDTEVLAIVDMSGSMGEGNMAPETINGVNVWLAGLSEGQQQGDKVTITVTVFDTQVETHVRRLPVRECPQFGTPGNPYEPRGGTALFDAVGDALSGIKEFVTDGKRAFVMILTDGQENASHRWNHQKLGALMAELEATQRYSFLYLGAGVDSWAQAQSYGDTSGLVTRSASYDRKDQSVAFAAAASTTMRYMGDSAALVNNLGEQVTANMVDLKKDAPKVGEKTPSS